MIGSVSAAGLMFCYASERSDKYINPPLVILREEDDCHCKR
jgi:hypothetical protein